MTNKIINAGTTIPTELIIPSIAKNKYITKLAKRKNENVEKEKEKIDTKKKKNIIIMIVKKMKTVKKIVKI